MAAENACAGCNGVSMALCPDNLCNACCEIGGRVMNAQNDDDPVGLLVNGSNTTVAGNGNAAAPEGIDMEHNVYRQTLRQSPTPKVMHAVDQSTGI